MRWVGGFKGIILKIQHRVLLFHRTKFYVYITFKRVRLNAGTISARAYAFRSSIREMNSL